MSTEVYKALADINWLSQRLKGIIALGEDIKAYDDLKNKSKGLSDAILAKKQEYEAADKDVSKATELKKNTEQEAAKIVSDAREKYDNIIADAHATSKTVRQKAEEEAKVLRQSANDDRIAIEQKVKDYSNKLTDLIARISDAENTHSRLTQAIENIKAKL